MRMITLPLALLCRPYYDRMTDRRVYQKYWSNLWEVSLCCHTSILTSTPSSSTLGRSLCAGAKVERINPLVALDGGVLFAAAGQIFGRIGNIINGDIVGYRSNLPWATVSQNPHSFLCMNLAAPPQCGSVATAVQPAAAYELLANIVF